MAYQSYLVKGPSDLILYINPKNGIPTWKKKPEYIKEKVIHVFLLVSICYASYINDLHKFIHVIYIWRLDFQWSFTKCNFYCCNLNLYHLMKDLLNTAIHLHCIKILQKSLLFSKLANSETWYMTYQADSIN